MAPLLCSLLLALSPPDDATSRPVDDAPASDAADTDADASADADTIEVVHLEQRVAASPTTGAASNMKGRFRIHLDGNVFGFSHRREWFESDHMPTDDVEDVTNTVGFGVGRYNFGVGLGYGITDGLIVGAKLGLGFSHSRYDPNNPPPIDPDAVSNDLTFLFRPYVEYAFIPGGRFRPFLFVHGGVAGGHSVLTDTERTGATLTTSVSPTLGGGGGVHIFVIPQVSIDVFAEVDHYFQLSKTKIEVDGEIDPDLGDPDYGRSAQLTEFNVLLGLSLWSGGK
ncbi:hypothetical protein ACNOYE_25630 [Nannocystaceae bacterium ST9]